ncbi:CWC26 [Candida oxycetoniae]|uniref:Pre-mRNA-splicing factor CWC26 n=1 Tax=Candida oxycetoniae TaxID=497107 RepID=A0AAI9SZD8_9ASCO|nr:CWC26 [Candida oxycetoniae]KAI3406043.2 CWC26 [Candida oxycetoniae]
MSRADYLARYLSVDDTNVRKSSDKKKKRKKEKEKGKEKEKREKDELVQVPSNLRIARPFFTETSASYNDEQLDVDVLEGDDDDESKPVIVANVKENRGFKRIDNGNLVDRTVTSQNPAEQQKRVTQQTIYRDSSGRMIDIDEAQRDFERKKEEEKRRKEIVIIRTSKQEQIKQELHDFKQKLDANFEDPISAFQESKQKQEEAAAVESEDKKRSGFRYNKGINLPNRFDISAGYFWDGVDRSNGFEKLMLRKINEQSYERMSSKVNEDYELDFD